MFRIDADDAVASRPTPEAPGSPSGYFTEGDPVGGVEATKVSRDWLNQTQEEVCGVILGAGIALDKSVETSQLLDAIKILTGGGDKPPETQTTNATPADLDTVAVAEGELWSVESTVIGRKSDGSDRYMATLKGCFYRNAAGDVTQEGTTHIDVEYNSDGSWASDLMADTGAQTIDVRVTGKAATTINWKCYTRAMKVT